MYGSVLSSYLPFPSQRHIWYEGIEAEWGQEAWVVLPRPQHRSLSFHRGALHPNPASLLSIPFSQCNSAQHLPFVCTCLLSVSYFSFRNPHSSAHAIISISVSLKIRLLYLKKIILSFFIWLCRVLVVAHGIFSWGMRTLSYSMWDLVPWPGIGPGPPALRAQNLSHWTTREVPEYTSF